MKITKLSETEIEVCISKDMLDNMGVTKQDIQTQSIKSMKLLDFVMHKVEDKYNTDLRGLPIGIGVVINEFGDLTMSIHIGIEDIDIQEKVRESIERNMDLESRKVSKDTISENIGAKELTSTTNTVNNTDDKVYISCFKTLDDVCFTCNRLINILRDELDNLYSSKLYKYNDDYYLSICIASVLDKELTSIIESVLDDYLINKLDTDNAKNSLFDIRMLEYGKVIVKDEAVQVLHNL